MTFADLIRTVLAHLETAAIPYMVTGSVASSYYGEPRATRDLDVVIEPDQRSLEDLLDRLTDDGFYVDGTRPGRPHIGAVCSMRSPPPR